MVEERLVQDFPGKHRESMERLGRGEKFFYFAEDEAGHSWAGEFFTQVPSNAFEWCWDTGSTTSRTLGLRKQVVVDAFPPSVQDHTINLVV